MEPRTGLGESVAIALAFSCDIGRVGASTWYEGSNVMLMGRSRTPIYVAFLASSSAIAIAVGACDSASGDCPATATCRDGGASCALGASCATSQPTGSVNGDTDASATVTATGAGPEWLQVRVTEGNSSWVGQPLHAVITLDSPESVDYNLYVYGDLEADASTVNGSFVADCTHLAGSSTLGTGQQDRVDLTWGESAGGFPNGLDDGRTLSLEVRRASTQCSSSAWKLSLIGNP